jgi:hypothetical protein
VKQSVVPALAIVFLALHLPYLPASLEDLDSINFALGIRHFDVAHHQPHPPGYPLFIAIAKAIHAVGGSEVHALSIVGIVAGALGVLAIGAVFARLRATDPSPAWTAAAVAVAIASPLYWFTTNRPLSDVAGLAAAVGVQVLILRATTTRALIVAGFCAALAVGLRSQVFWLTAPLLVWRLGANVGARGFSRASVASAYAAGVFAWAIPLVAIAGGPRAYWHAVFDQGAEDLTGIRMLWTTPTIREFADALYYAFVAPWALWPLAALVLILAAAGILVLWRRDRRALATLAIAFAPYFLFDLLFQETFTSRYALPLVIPIAYLSIAGARTLPATAGLAIAIGIAMFSAHVGGTSLAAYSRQPSPGFRLLADMIRAEAAGEPPVVAMDRREALDLRRPIAWTGMPTVAASLPSPPQHEWLELVKYWNGGGRAPVWFVADPKRADIALVQHGAPISYRWGLPYPVLIDGVRPNEMDWYRIEQPEWYVGEGWALTPEAAGVSQAGHRGLDSGPIETWIARRTRDGTMMIGGRNFERSGSRLSVDVDGRPLDDWSAAPGFFLHTLALPGIDAGDGFVKITIRTTPRSRVAIEQFDASATRPLVGFGEGWHEAEYNPTTGLKWRWLSEHGELKVSPANVPLVLHLEGESPLKYFSRGSRLHVRSGERVVFDELVSSDFSVTIPIADQRGTIVLETDQTYVPAERSRRTQDRRRLGLRIFTCEVRPISARGR